MKTLIKITLLGIAFWTLVSLFSGCASAPPSSDNLSGSWKGPGSEAVVRDDVITINLVGDDGSALYWQGTFPDEAKDGDTIISQADTEALSSAVLGSTDETKEFLYADGELNFTVSMMGTTTKFHLQK